MSMSKLALKRVQDKLNPPKRPTLKVIAELAGVSISTAWKMKTGQSVEGDKAEAIAAALEKWEFLRSEGKLPVT